MHLVGTRGFTLVELLVVIAIIGILASVVLAGLNAARNQAQITRARAELGQLSEAFYYAKLISGKTLPQITGSGYSMSPCVGAGDLRGTTGACYTGWTAALADIEPVAGSAYGNISRFKRDPWGSPYLLDENEGEYPADLCRTDTVRSAGPDGSYDTSGDNINSPKSIPFVLSDCN